MPPHRHPAALFYSALWRLLMILLLLWLGGFKWALASTAAVLNQLSTVSTILFARIFLGEGITPRRGLGALAAVIGAVAVILSRSG